MDGRHFASTLSGALLAALLVVAPARAQGADLLVTGYFSNVAYRVDGQTGEFLQQFGAGQLDAPAGIALDAGGRLYIAEYDQGRVSRFNAATGEFLGVFSSTPITGPWGLTFGPDGHLYVTAFNDGTIRKLDGATGAELAVFASGTELLNSRGLAFGPDGNLYVATSFDPDGVLRVDGQTGAIIDTFAVLPGAATGLAFGPDGDLYVSVVNVSTSTAQVDRLDGQTGALLDVLSAAGVLQNPHGLAFGDDGLLYVCDSQNSTVVRFDVGTGGLVDVFAQLPMNSSPIFPIFFEQAECFLVIGDGPGDDVYFGANHFFDTHVGGVQDSYAVLMEDIPQFVLPVAGLSGTAGSIGIGAQVSAAWGDGVPEWMKDGRFTVQVLLWNPAVFPQFPEQSSYGLAVQVAPDGTVTTRAYGDGTGIEVWAETDVDANGQPVVRFPFTIPGF